MTRGVALASAGTALALAASCLWVPCVPPWVEYVSVAQADVLPNGHLRAEPLTSVVLREAPTVRYRWVWDRADRWYVPRPAPPDRVAWWALAAEQAAVLLAGGGLVAFLVRRTRRRRAGALR